MRCLKGSKERNIIVGENEQGKQLNQLRQPTGLSFDREGNIYVADCGNNLVVKFVLN